MAGERRRRHAEAARRQDLRPHRHLADAVARGRQGDDRVARRQGRGLGIEEDRLRRRRGRSRVEASEGRSARRPGRRRGAAHGFAGPRVTSAWRWLDDARRVADQPRDPAREPLFASDGDDAIGSLEPVLARSLIAAGLPLWPTTRGWRVDAPLARSLATIARWLDAHGLAAPWRDELLAVTTSAGEPIGVVERAVVRVLGISTCAVHLVGVRDEGRYWVQQRSFAKATDPGRWDTLMGGQVAAGESIEATLERETMEEAGLAIADLRDLERGAPILIRRPVAEG